MQNISKNVSNQYGRALEYVIVAEISQQLQNQLHLTQRAATDQSRDRIHYLNLPSTIQQIYQKSAVHIYNWLSNKLSFSDEIVMLDRLPDVAGSGESADVTDIKVSKDSVDMHLSIKRNHKALKHQRPSSTAQQCGYVLNSQEDISFRESYTNTLNTFKSVAGNRTLFSNLEKEIIRDYLYRPICQLVVDFLNGYCKQATHANFLFRFLVGNKNFYKVTLFDKPTKRKYLLIQEFINITSATSVVAKVLPTKYYNYLHFRSLMDGICE
ncbi:MAG: HaeIII family restriction endonuclease [Stenomitos frigidus ULC029]